MTAPMLDAPMIDPATGRPYGEDSLRDLFGPEAFAGVGSGQTPNQITAPNAPDDDDAAEPVERYRDLMAALYGNDFPLIKAFDVVIDTYPPQPEEPAEAAALDPTRTYREQGIMPPLEALIPHTDNDQWATWVRTRWDLHRAAVSDHLHLVARNRLFRAGQQWVSSRTGGRWQEPPKPAESARVVENRITPALDQRLQVVKDQRPGFQVEPTSLSPDEKRKAEGRQQALEYQFDGQKMKDKQAEACYWAQTDGVSFLHTYWDRDKGPWDESMGEGGEKKPLGDLDTKVLRVEQVRVSANATGTEDPYYLIVREVLSETESAYLYGAAGVQSKAQTGDIGGNGDTDGTGPDSNMPSWVLTQTLAGEGNRLQNIPTVERYTMYVDRHADVLPYGLQLVVVGNAVVWGPGELLFGVIPVAPMYDGSTDPSYYKRPIMEQWIPAQMRVNAALSYWVNNARANAGGKLLAKADAISRETYTGGMTGLIEVQSPGPIQDAVFPVAGFSIGQDIKDLIAFDIKSLEDMSGYNDVSRGQLSGETATAVSIANEQLQRVFAPPVGAAARCMESWGTIQIAGMAWGYEVPRTLSAVGKDRPDLARALSAEDFDGPCTVRVDPEKMMPMPKVYRLALMDQAYDRQLITGQQYLRNVPFATFKNLTSPDEDQEARAKRVADAIRMQEPNIPPIRWQTNEAIEQDVLEREILLQDDLPPDVIAVADDRWKALAQQAAMKQGALMPSPGGMGAPAGPESGAPEDTSAGLPGGEPTAPSPATPEPLANPSEMSPAPMVG